MMTGRVIRSTGSFYEVKGDDGRVYTCRLKGRFRLSDSRLTNPIAVGDFVDFGPDHRGDNMVITNIHDRRNYLIRQSNKLSKAWQVIAANVDRLVILATLSSPRTSTGFIDRMLVTAEMYHIAPVILFNKRDAYTPEELEEAEELMRTYRQIGYPSKLVSALNISDMQKMRVELKQSVSLLAGHSGVGKSTILNALIPGTGQRTAEVSGYHQKGMHTTTFAEMFDGENGMELIDTPGIKDFGLVFVEKHELAGYFPEFRREMSSCKFNNCLHVNEPGCAVLNALVQGDIAEFRYVNYLNMLTGLLSE